MGYYKILKKTHTHTQNDTILCRFSDIYLTINSFYSHLGTLNSLSRSRPSRLAFSLSLAVSPAWVAPRSNSNSPRQTTVSHNPFLLVLMETEWERLCLTVCSCACECDCVSCWLVVVQCSVRKWVRDLELEMEIGQRHACECVDSIS